MKFCDISTRNELADFLKISRQKLTHLLYVVYPNNCYNTFEIPKKNGGTRTINAPNDSLKGIQSKLATELEKYKEDFSKENDIKINISHAFEKHKGIITNAKIHRNKRYVLNIDLQDFFNSFHFGRVCGYFEKNKYFELPHEVAVVISQLCCYNGVLPQGAPTSPTITNLIFQILDMKILRLAKKYKLDYTRYADDMTFSTNYKGFLDTQADFYENLRSLLSKEGFSINESKTRLQFNNSRQVVTGLIVNKKINIDHSYYKNTRAMAHYLYAHDEFNINGVSSTIEQLEGRFAFINQLDKYNNSIDGKARHNFYELNGREKQYQKFLFYKYFFASSKPIIITEGKTDVLYIKAALKNLCEKYPELIERDKKGNYTYKVTFLKRTKRFEYFLGFVLDGADAMKNLVNFFRDNNAKQFTNYLSYFKHISNKKPSNAVILLFDNELSNKNKPLKKFANGILNDQELTKLKGNLSIKIIEDSNLFLVTNPLVDGAEESEIEELFKSETRDVLLDGKKLSLKDSYDTGKYFGKDHFSKYVLKNYKSIDFSGFKPLLDTIKNVIAQY